MTKSTLEPQTGVAYTVDPGRGYDAPRPFALVTPELVRVVVRRGRTTVETASSARWFGESTLGMLAVRVLGDRVDGEDALVLDIASRLTVDLLGSDIATPTQRLNVKDHGYALGWMWAIEVPGLGQDSAVIAYTRKPRESFVLYAESLAVHEEQEAKRRAHAAERDRVRARAAAAAARLDEWVEASPIPEPPKTHQGYSDSGHVTLHHVVLDALLDAAGHPDEHLGHS